MTSRLSIRARLFVLSITIILVVGLIGGTWLVANLRASMESRIETELIQTANVFSEVLNNTSKEMIVGEIDSITDRLGRESAVRFTVINGDGTVLGDSEIETSEIGTMENHGGRPEVMGAMDSGFGISRRYSMTLDARMLYIAVPFRNENGSGVVRVALPLSEIDTAVGRIRWTIMVAGLISLVLAAIMSGIASDYMSSTLRSLIEYARGVSERKHRSRPELYQHDEFGKIAGSINKMAEDLELAFSELAKERNQLHTVLESMNDGVLAVDEDRKVTLVNSAAIKLLELTDSVAGKNLTDILRAPALFEAISNHREGSQISTEFDLPGYGTPRILAAITPMETIGGWLIVMRDVTEIRKLETARRDFYANASHELRTPVGIIHANIETLLNGAMDDEKFSREFLNGIYRGSLRLTNLLNDLLQISRIEEGKYELELVPVQIGKVLQSSLEAISQLAETKNISITNNVTDEIDAIADSKALDEILVNLLENAIKYTPASGKVVIRAMQENDRVLIRVEDNGPGITPVHRIRIFERFYRVDPGRSREMGGTGLGLAIVKHLVNAMRGEVWMEPAPVGGSVFVVSLSPAKKV